LKRSERIEWFLRIVTFGSALVVGIIGAWSIWVSFKDTLTLFVFILAFAAIFASMIYIVKKRKLRMLQT
jgi:hypothetical protein